MRIGHKPEFIYLSNPKCGSSSVRAIMNKYTDIYAEHHPDDPAYLLHINACALKSYFEHEYYKDKAVGPWEKYYKFTTVRNPWKKMVSYYFFSAPDKDFRAAKDIRQQRVMGKVDYDQSTAFHHGFNPWLKHIMDGGGLPHYEYFCCDHDNPSNCLVDDVFKIEDINDTLPAALSEHLDININKVPHLGPDMELDKFNSRYTQWEGDYYSLYDEESKNTIAQVYESDINNFHYEFGE